MASKQWYAVLLIPRLCHRIDNFPSKVDDLKTIWSPLYKLQKFKTFKVKGQAAGVYKNAGLFSYVRIYGAGHEVPAYKVWVTSTLLGI